MQPLQTKNPVPPARSWRTWPLSRAKSTLMWNLRNTGAGRTWTHWHGSHWRRNRPRIPDLSREELVELVEIIQHCSVTGREWAMRYYTALLRRSLSLPNVMDFVASGEDVEVIAEKLLQAAR